MSRHGFNEEDRVLFVGEDRTRHGQPATVVVSRGGFIVRFDNPILGWKRNGRSGHWHCQPEAVVLIHSERSYDMD